MTIERLEQLATIAEACGQRLSAAGRAAVAVDGKSRTVEVDARALQSFAAFQRAVANTLGIWLDDPYSTRRPRDAKERWQDDVADAFRAGRKGGEAE